MAVAHFYDRFFQSLCNKEINITADTFKLILVDGTYTPDQGAHRYKSSVTGEVSGAGYTAGGAAVASMAVAVDAVTHKVSFSGAAVSWPGSTITARYAVLYDSTPSTDATRPLVGFVDFGGPIASTAATFAVTWDSSGIGAVSVA